MKTLLITLALAFISTLGFGQCTPNAAFTAPGVYPDSANNLETAHSLSAYSTTMTLVVPLDSMVGQFAVDIDYIELYDFTGFPPSFSYQCAPSDCKFPGNASSCILITGNPTADEIGDWPLTAVLHGYAVGIGAPFVDTVDYYRIRVTWPVGDDSPHHQIIPASAKHNRANDLITVRYGLTQREDVTINLFDLSGRLVRSVKQEGLLGTNQTKLSCSGLHGVFIYTVNGEHTKIPAQKIVIE